MTRAPLALAAALAALALPAAATTPWETARKAVGSATTGKLEKAVNDRLLAESRKNQCSFQTDSDVLEKGCDPKARRLANAIVDAKKRLNAAGLKNFTFEVSGHTDSSGSVDHNRTLSQRRAEVMKRELVAKGIPADEIVAVGRGSEAPLVKPDDTPAKKAKNRRYEVRVKL